MIALPLGRIAAWAIALLWAARVLEAARGIPTLHDLTSADYDRQPPAGTSLTVIVPARNEAADIQDCLSSLLAQDMPVHVIAVDDRSTDATGALMDAILSPQLQVLHVKDLPTGWLGKTHAMHVAAQLLQTEWLLFTDADVTFRPDALRRALVYALESGADHLVLAPTTIIKRWDEAALLSFFSVFGLWAARPWRVARPNAPRDAIGIGAFNMVRRTAYEQMGGFGALRMQIVEDLAFGQRVKRLGLQQRFAYGPRLVNVHWASGTPGLVSVMTKNIFAVLRYQPLLVLVACLWLMTFCVGPFALVSWLRYTAPAGFALMWIAYAYWLMRPLTSLRARNAVFTPFAAMLFAYAIVRSMMVTLWQGGVIWRGTFYPLAELRREAEPLFGKGKS